MGKKKLGYHPDARRKSAMKHKMVDRWGNKCYICGKELTYSEITIDHVIPSSKGGTDHVNNLRPCCRSCNNRKADKVLEK